MSYELAWTLNGGNTTTVSYDTLQEVSDAIDTNAAAANTDDTVLFTVTYTDDGRRFGGSFTAT